MYNKSNNTDIVEMTDPMLLAMVGNFVKQTRLKMNISQDELAHKSGLTRLSIARLESGHGATLKNFIRVLRSIRELNLLEGFRYNDEPTPIEIYNMMKKQSRRKRAGRSDSGTKKIST